MYIGDNLYTDVLFAKNAGIKACLVLSGMTKPTDPIPDELNPDIMMIGLHD